MFDKAQCAPMIELAFDPPVVPTVYTAYERLLEFGGFLERGSSFVNQRHAKPAIHPGARFV